MIVFFIKGNVTELSNIVSSLNVSTENPILYFTEGLEKINSNDITGSLESFINAVEIDPIFSPSHFMIGEIYTTIKKWESALLFTEASCRIEEKLVPNCQELHELTGVKNRIKFIKKKISNNGQESQM